MNHKELPGNIKQTGGKLVDDSSSTTAQYGDGKKSGVYTRATQDKDTLEVFKYDAKNKTYESLGTISTKLNVSDYYKNYIGPW